MTINKKFIVLTILLIILPSISIAESSRVKGVYSLMKRMSPVEPSVLKLSFVEGVSVRVPWASIEPGEGKFDWDYPDKVLREIKKTNKKAMLRILPGVQSPRWIYKKGVTAIEFKDPNPHRKTFGKILTMPVPWDESYIKAWIKFVDILGRRYSSNDALILIHMAGPTVKSAEMHLLKRGRDRKLIQEAGYSKDRIIAVWRKVIDAYSEAFPEKALSLNIAVPYRKDGAMEEIIQYGISKIGERFCIQGNWLSAYTKDRFHPYSAILTLHEKSKVNVGFQMLAPSKNISRQGPLDMAIKRGLHAGARYFEIYQSDILDRRHRQLLEELAKTLK